MCMCVYIQDIYMYVYILELYVYIYIVSFRAGGDLVSFIFFS